MSSRRSARRQGLCSRIRAWPGGGDPAPDISGFDGCDIGPTHRRFEMQRRAVRGLEYVAIAEDAVAGDLGDATPGCRKACRIVTRRFGSTMSHKARKIQCVEDARRALAMLYVANGIREATSESYRAPKSVDWGRG